MAYKCVHCSALYTDGNSALLSGCEQCKSKFFFYIAEKKLKEIQQQQQQEELLELKLSSAEKEQMEKDVREIAGLKADEDAPVFLDFESVKVLKPGKYLLDLQKLFAKEKPHVYQLEDGKYIIDLTGSAIDELADT